MTISAQAGAVGLNLLSQHGPQLMKLAGALGGDTARGFAQATRNAMEKGLGRLAEGQVGGPLFRQKPGQLNGLSTQQAYHYFERFDANGDGQLSKQEINKGLVSLEKDIAAKANKKNLSERDMDVLQGLYQAKQFASSIIRNYDTLANLDGSSFSVSKTDLMHLAGQDGQIRSISQQDWQALRPTPNRPASTSVNQTV